MTGRVRLPAAHEFALCAFRASCELEAARLHAAYSWIRIRELAGVLLELAAQRENYGPWLSDAGEAVHRALERTCGRALTTTGDLTAEFEQLAQAFADVQETSPADELERLRDFSVALARAAQAEASRR